MIDTPEGTDVSGSDWTLDTLAVYFNVQLAAMDRRITEQLTAIQIAATTSVAAAQEVAAAQHESMERAFRGHLEQIRRETDAMFASSDRAITKAEIATDKRFTSVNEFRAQLSDQAARFVARTEFEAEATALRAEQRSASERNAERIQEITDRMNRSEGKNSGLNASWIYLLGALGAIGTVVSLLVAFRIGF